MVGTAGSGGDGRDEIEGTGMAGSLVNM